MTLERRGTRAKLTVEDTGVGVFEEDLDRIFDRFYRGRDSNAQPGSGLGLSIVKPIVDSHGGELSVASTKRGTRFVVEFPLTGN